MNPGKPRAPRAVFALGGPSCGLRAALPAAWREAVERGLVLYDPSRTERFESGPFRFHLFPERASRPGATRPTAGGLRSPHEPCPFDGEDFALEREFARLERGGRAYHLAANRYPIAPRHFIGVRSASSPGLSQCVQSAEEVEDMLLAAEALGAEYRVHFNSNPGRDGSQSGSSVNHWHFQAFAYPSEFSPGISGAEIALGPSEDGVRAGPVRAGPARAFALEAEPNAFRRAAEVLWERIARLTASEAAYNLEVRRLPHGFRALLFARRPAPDLEIPGAGILSANFGGWELSGDIVIPTRPVFAWLRAHPEEAAELLRRRLAESTREVP
ncbi:MAG: hypothetical protein ACUVYA_03445 [Planctomycetota bacterium]